MNTLMYDQLANGSYIFFGVLLRRTSCEATQFVEDLLRKDTMTMKYITRLLAFLLISTTMLTSCQDPITLGTDLLDEDQVNVGFTDSLDLRARVIRGDTVLVYGPALNQRLDNYLFGDFEDPLFGQSLATLYSQVRLQRSKPDFSDTALDSVLLVLPYDTTKVYGEIEGENFSLEVHRLTEDMSNIALYYSNISFATDPNPLATFDFIPSLDSIEVVEFVSSNVQETVSYPHLRIPLSQGLGEELLGLDTTVTANDSTWLDYFKGLQIRPTQSTPGLLSFDLNDARAGIYLYYTQDDTIKRQFQFEVDNAAARLSSYEHDYTGAPAEAFIDNYETSDSLLFLQGMAGLNTEIELLNLDQERFENIIINKAELELQVKPTVDSARFPLPEQLILSTRSSSGALQVIPDISLSANSGTGLGAFGGQYDEDTGSYTMNISAYLQEALQNSTSKRLILSAFPKAENPERIVLYGPGNQIKNVKLRLAFTRL